MIHWKQGVLIVMLLIVCMTVAFVEKGQTEETPLLIVTDSYEPFVFAPDADLKGIDYEVTEAVFQQLNIPIEIKFYPWKRCLAMMQDQAADGILDAAITNERKTYLFFPEEPLSDSSLVMFYHKDRPISVDTLDDLRQYRIGAQLGYEYPQGLAEMLVNREDVTTMEQNFQKLVANRIDLTIENRVVGLYRASVFGVRDQIDVFELPTIFPSKNYLGFAKKAGYDELSVKFSRALLEFKQTQAYHDILVKYGQVQ